MEATITSGRFPAGTVVAIHPLEVWPTASTPVGPPTGGAPILTATMPASGTLLINGLEADRGYWAVAEVAGEWRWVKLRTAASQAAEFSTTDPEDTAVIVDVPADQSEDIFVIRKGGVDVLAIDENGDLTTGGGRLWVNVKTFGAIGDNVANDTAAIQAALDFLNDQVKAPFGGTLYFPAGKYRVSAGFELKNSGITVCGEGRASQLVAVAPMANGTWFFKTGERPATAAELLVAPLVPTYKLEGVTVSDLFLWCNNIANGVWINGPTSGEPANAVRHMQMRNVREVGVRLGVQGVTSFSLWCEHNHISCHDNGISVAIENFGYDNIINFNRCINYSVAGLKNHAGVAMLTGNHWGTTNLHATNRPVAILARSGAVHSVADYFDWHRQNHTILVQPQLGESVSTITIENAICIFDSYNAAGTSRADALYSFVRCDDTIAGANSIGTVNVKGNNIAAETSSYRMKAILSLSSTSINAHLEGNRARYCASFYDTAGATPAVRSNNHIHTGAGWGRPNTYSTSLASGNGVQTVFTIPHGIPGTPSAVVTPRSADAAGAFYVTTDATNITITYLAAPPAGVSNLGWNWRADL